MPKHKSSKYLEENRKLKEVLLPIIKIREVKENKNILSVNEKTMLEFFQVWVKVDVKDMPSNQLVHFWYLFGQWCARLAKLIRE